MMKSDFAVFPSLYRYSCQQHYTKSAISEQSVKWEMRQLVTLTGLPLLVNADGSGYSYGNGVYQSTNVGGAAQAQAHAQAMPHERMEAQPGQAQDLPGRVNQRMQGI